MQAPTGPAAQRLAALQRHLAGFSIAEVHQPGLEREDTAAAKDIDPRKRPAPGGGPGSLTIIDNRCKCS